MKHKQEAAFRVLYLLALALTAFWALQPSLGPWTRVEATVFGRDRDLYTAVEEDEANEYYAVLDLCYDYEGVVYVTQQYLEHDGPNGWQLQDLVQAVEEAKRHPLGEVREIFISTDSPTRWTAQPPGLWFPITLFVLYAVVSLVLAWESPIIQFVFLAVALLFSLVLRLGDDSEAVPRELDPRPLVSESQARRAFDHIPLEGSRKLDSLESVLEKWGRPDSAWLESEEGMELAYLLYRDGPQWTRTWLHTFRRENARWVPVGPPQEGER